MIIDSVNKNKSTPRSFTGVIPWSLDGYRQRERVGAAVAAAAAADGVPSCPGPAPATFALT